MSIKKHVLCISALLLLCSIPTARSQTPAQALASATKNESAAGVGLSASYKGTLRDLRSVGRGDFTITVQGGDQCVYEVLDIETKEEGFYWYNKGEAWSRTTRKELSNLRGASAISIRLMALLFSPNRLSSLQAQSRQCSPASQSSTYDYTLQCILNNGLEIKVYLNKENKLLRKVEYVIDGQKQAMIFSNYKIVEKIPTFFIVENLREGLLNRIYTVDRVEYREKLADQKFQPEQQPVVKE